MVDWGTNMDSRCRIWGESDVVSLDHSQIPGAHIKPPVWLSEQELSIWLPLFDAVFMANSTLLQAHLWHLNKSSDLALGSPIGHALLIWALTLDLPELASTCNQIAERLKSHHLILKTNIKCHTRFIPNLTIVETLLQNGADSNSTARSFRPALHLILCMRCRPYVGTYEEDPGNSSSRLELVGASGSKNIQLGLLELLIKYNVDVDCMDAEGCSALNVAVKTGNYAAVKVLCANNAQIDLRGPPNDETPLTAATIGQQITIMELLLSCGANVNAFDTWGEIQPLIFMLSHAPYEHMHSSVLMLLRYGADVNVTNSHGQSPLHLAVSRMDPNVDTVRVLLEAGAFLEIQNWCRQTPLTAAISRAGLVGNNSDIVKTLLFHGADIRAIATMSHDERMGETISKRQFIEAVHYMAEGDPATLTLAVLVGLPAHALPCIRENTCAIYQSMDQNDSRCALLSNPCLKAFLLQRMDKPMLLQEICCTKLRRHLVSLTGTSIANITKKLALPKLLLDDVSLVRYAPRETTVMD